MQTGAGQGRESSLKARPGGTASSRTADDAQVAQLVEQGTENPRVGGSNPSLGTILPARPLLPIQDAIAISSLCQSRQAFKRHLKLEQQQCTTTSIRNLNENYRGMLLKQPIVARETPNLSPSITKGASNPLESVYASGVIV